MLINIVIGFIIPWILGAYLYKAHPKLVLVAAPIGSVLAFAFDVLGYQLKFWHVTPIYDVEVFAALPMHLGIYPVLTCYLVYSLKYFSLNPFLLVLFFTLLTTMIEYAGVVIGKVLYFNDWNIFWTFWSYFIPYLIVFWYYNSLKKHKIL